jgi:nucleoside-diphosphate-sugar epimerase
LHCAAIIPPASYHNPKLAESSNYGGTKNLIDAVNASKRKDEIKFVEIGTVAEYGNRDFKHPWGRVGDPLIVSAFDFYAVTKLKAERYVIESGLKYWVSLRQSGILYDNVLYNNMSDGLMFHTHWNTPIEWATARTSGLMLKNLVVKDSEGTLPQNFWRRCYNIGNGKDARVTGYDTVNRGFKMMGCSAKQIFKPNWNIARNFHCMWYYDSSVLNDYLDFQYEGFEDFFSKLEKKLWFFKLGKPFKGIIRKAGIERLFKNSNSPMFWLNNNIEGRIKAFFKSREDYNKIPSDWKDYNLLCEGKTPDGKDIDYNDLKDITKVKEKGLLLSHGYDESKPDSELDIADMQQAAEFRGGKCLSSKMTKGDLYTKLEWQDHEGNKFTATPYLILKTGHWSEKLAPAPWNFDEIAKNSPFVAQIWYDTHDVTENNFFDADCYKDIIAFEKK